MEFVLFVMLYIQHDDRMRHDPVSIKMEQLVDQASCEERATAFHRDSRLEDDDGNVIPTYVTTLCMPADMVVFEDHTQDGLVVEQVAPKQ